MKLLILTQYFPPEVGAPQNRLFGLARHLVSSGVDVTVLTAMPNYPQMRIHDNYKGKSYVFEEMGGIKVHRSFIYVSRQRSVAHRLRNYFSFVWSSARTGNRRLGSFDFLFCESPPLFLGYSAMFLARRKKAKLIFNVSDLWPESAEKLRVVTNKLLLQTAYRLEARLYRKAALVTGQTQGICGNIARRFPSVRTYWLPNGADLDDFDPRRGERGLWRKRHGIPEGDVVMLYAGIIGIAQGLEVIMDCAQHFRSQRNVWFVLLGDGPERDKLLQLKNAQSLDKVLLLPAVSRAEMPAVLADATASIVPLKNLPIFRGAIPSKIFECLAMEVPVILGVDGEARELFVEKGKCALYFAPGDTVELAHAVEKILENDNLRRQLGMNGREFVKAHFDRARIAAGFFEVLRDLRR